MSRKFIISEEQEKELIRRINEETYQMPVDKKMNKPYCINPEKVLIIKKFLDKTFKVHDFEKIGSNGMPIITKVFSMNASNGEPLKYMYKTQLHDLLIDKFQNMFLDKIERDLFMKQVIEDWVNGTIGIFGTLSKNSLMENTIEEVDILANEANTTPTDKQKEAGNYKKGHVRICGMPISIETPKGNFRKYKNEDGTEDKIRIKYHYGYFTNTTGNGKDGDAVDVFIGPNINDILYVYVVDQNNKDGEFDESKVMLGFNSAKHAKDAYTSCYSSDWKGFRNITKVSLEVFKKWLYRNRKQQKPFHDYYYIQKKKIDEGSNDKNYFKIAKVENENTAMKIINELYRKSFNSYYDEPYIFAENVNVCKDIVENYLYKKTDLDPKYVISEAVLNEEEYNQICKIVEVDNIDMADEIADEINKKGIYAYTENNIVYAVIEQDFMDTYYVEDTVRKCKELAYKMCDERNCGSIEMIKEQIENEDVRHIGNLILTSYSKGSKYTVYENNKRIGEFGGNINIVTENDVIDEIE